LLKCLKRIFSSAPKGMPVTTIVRSTEPTWWFCWSFFVACYGDIPGENHGKMEVYSWENHRKTIGFNGNLPGLVMTNSLRTCKWPLIVDKNLLWIMVIFHSYVSLPEGMPKMWLSLTF
jgi:hypothetical protein